jgi:hypothetical protein
LSVPLVTLNLLNLIMLLAPKKTLAELLGHDAIV